MAIVLQCSRCRSDTATLMKIFLRCDYASVALRVHSDVAIVNFEQVKTVAERWRSWRFYYASHTSLVLLLCFYYALAVSAAICVILTKISNRRISKSPSSGKEVIRIARKICSRLFIQNDKLDVYSETLHAQFITRRNNMFMFIFINVLFF